MCFLCDAFSILLLSLCLVCRSDCAASVCKKPYLILLRDAAEFYWSYHTASGVELVDRLKQFKLLIFHLNIKMVKYHPFIPLHFKRKHCTVQHSEECCSDYCRWKCVGLSICHSFQSALSLSHPSCLLIKTMRCRISLIWTLSHMMRVSLAFTSFH